MRRLLRLLMPVLIVAWFTLGPVVPAAGGLVRESAVLAVPRSSGAVPDDEHSGSKHPRWRWPVAEHRVTVPFRAPAHAYGAGHRGIDLAAPEGSEVLAPADGVVAFRGTVVDRALITIEHPGGYVSTFEPLSSGLSPGDTVRAGEPIGVVAEGGHAAQGDIHLGVRVDGAYVNPLLLLGEAPRAVLLPCCEGL